VGITGKKSKVTFIDHKVMAVKFIPSIIYSKFQEMPRYENSTPGKFQENTIINSKEPKY
jgi:hypothetical protein